MTNKNIPNVRFVGFDDVWEKKFFTDFLTRKTASSDSAKLPKLEFEDIISGEGRLNKDISKKFDDRKGVEFREKDILFGKLRPYLKNWYYADFPGVALGDFWVFEADNSDTSFDYYLIQAPHFQKVANDTSGTKMPRSDWKTVSNTKYAIPTSIAEQSQIGSLFSTIDSLLSFYKDNLENYQAFKKSMLSKMFPRAGQTVPEIRLDGFESEWEKRKLNTIVERVTRKNSELISERALTISAQYGLVDQEDFFNKKVASKDVSGYYLINNGEFAYNKSYSNGYPLGTIKRLDKYKCGVLSTLYILFRPIDVNSDFLACYYESNKWHKEVSMCAAEGARNHGLLNIAPADFFNTELVIPRDKAEQRAIGSFFSNLDELISSYQTKIDELEMLKKKLLQDMFV
ncbi:type I restriction enzyme, S subunit [Streptococcus henryi]|uniref:Type I restriction enzyme, S subunit n=1 Tax=Streptococcus henryi TaxID=439219 RepID=A0A1G6B678_9STRE|nr:restriction endonuclease subunit S [Streptococcus henryi]SDB16168.1 type I restriction enzyme, S subunit [Streptococcus henryi]